MANVSGIRLQDTENLVGRLQALDDRAQSLIRAALQKAARPIVRAAAAAAPTRTGALKLAQGVAVRVPRKGRQYVVIGARRGIKSSAVKRASAAGLKVEPANYAHLVEFGTRPHPITARQVRQYAFEGQPRRTVDHPGAAPHPHLGPAAQSLGPGALEAVRAELAMLVREAERVNG